MILFDNIIEILDLADGDRGAVLLVVALDGRCIGRTPINGDFLRHTVAANRFLEKAERGRLVPLLGEQKVNGLAGLIPTVSPLLTPITSRNVLLLQSLPNSIPYRQDNVRRRKDDTCLGTATRSIVERLSRVP